VFLTNLYVGPCGAWKPRILAYKKEGINPDEYVLVNRDYSTRLEKALRAPFPTGNAPLFIDLQALPEDDDTIKRYMIPILKIDALAVAKFLKQGRKVYINCKLGRNRSAMFAMAVVVTYYRMYMNEPGFTASEALAILQGGRPVLKPEEWVMRGFRKMGFEPSLGRRPISPVRRFGYDEDSEEDSDESEEEEEEDEEEDSDEPYDLDVDI